MKNDLVPPADENDATLAIDKLVASLRGFTNYKNKHLIDHNRLLQQQQSLQPTNDTFPQLSFLIHLNAPRLQWCDRNIETLQLQITDALPKDALGAPLFDYLNKYAIQEEEKTTVPSPAPIQ